MTGLEFLSGVLVGLLAGFSIQKRFILAKLALMEKIGLLKLADASQIEPLTNEFLKKQLEEIRRRKGERK